MLKMNEIAAAVRRMVCVGSVVLVGVAGTERVMASEVADADAVVQKSMPATTDSAASETRVGVKVIPAEGADALVVKQLIEADIRKLGDAPRSLKEVDRWSDVLTTALRQGGFPLGQVLMTDVDWRAAQKGGEAQFTVIPGRIRNIVVNNKSRVADARLQRLIAHALCGSARESGVCLLRTSRLERATQLLQDVPGVAIDGAPHFSRGAGTGDVDVTFNIAQKGKPASLDLILDNKGVESTGTYRAGVTASANNLFHAGDAYAFTITSTDKKMWTGSLTGSAPIFDDGLRMTGGVSRQQYFINAGTPVKGVATTGQAGVQYPFARGLDANVWGGASILHSQTSTDLTYYDATTHSKLDSLQLSLTADNGERARALRTNLAAGQIALTLGHQRNDDKSDPVTQRSGNYAKFTGTAFGTYALSKSGNTFISGRVTGQLASRNLDASEKLGLSGPDAVRAYRADEASADEGVVASVGLYQRIPVASGHQIQLGLFNDFAYGRVNHSPWDGWQNTYPGVDGVTNNRVLAGYGVSVDWLTPIGATVSASVSKPYRFSESSWMEPGKKPAQYWLSVTWSH
ncbi:ShlB/FhaC/HecB family hemolysin secretion/activation protein [Caballeronia sp. LZ062]|uniref:ShlB/FhaC/HecB family hemolysin secretion/activation protein n=1 Tax=unclassified Caballeronia TaxID=2646786 RepID=UPI002867A72E|nr:MULTISPECIES: ShlB/FhaC/HecB family hemolysin secretion/activation protein [unclassified Caballeronia]MDR5856426.1 ShlB/FhaC/HecB family hemolysin secretion/activation protein [Caballeronia sp. LZ050]MDR5873096.1 ShlB/FhaC/HecB family hemolysin secretion/activation protein [Caballeronia sp. LZ062]